MKIFELFDTFTKINVIYEGNRSVSYSFELDDKTYEIGFSEARPTGKITGQKNMWDCAFELKDHKNHSAGGKFGVTGTGDAFKVFSIVKQCIEQFFQNAPTLRY